MAKPIIIIQENNNDEIAYCNVISGEIFIDKSIWEGLNEKQRKYLVMHELMHIKHPNATESQVDNYVKNDLPPDKRVEYVRIMAILRSLYGN